MKNSMITIIINIYFFLVNYVVNLETSNSGNTFSKTINNTYNIYGSFLNDTLIIDYGDSTSQQIQFNSSNKFIYLILYVYICLFNYIL